MIRWEAAESTLKDVASYFIASERDAPSRRLTGINLQLLLYLSQGWHLAYYQKPLFKDEIFVINNVVSFNLFKNEGPDFADKVLDMCSVNFTTPSQVGNLTDVLSESTRRFLNQVRSTFAEYLSDDQRIEFLEFFPERVRNKKNRRKISKALTQKHFVARLLHDSNLGTVEIVHDPETIEEYEKIKLAALEREPYKSVAISGGGRVLELEPDESVATSGGAARLALVG